MYELQNSILPIRNIKPCRDYAPQDNTVRWRANRTFAFVTFITVWSFSFPYSAAGQQQEDFLMLAEQARHYLKEYDKLSPFDDTGQQIADLHLSDTEWQAVMQSAQGTISGKNAADNILLLQWLQQKIFSALQAIAAHPQFQEYDIKSLLKSNALAIVISDDHQLFCFSLDEKTGGTYRSRISLMHYTAAGMEGRMKQEALYSVFLKDGYDNIYALPADEGTRYILTGTQTVCATCYETVVQLVQYRHQNFTEVFRKTVVSRDIEEGVWYDPDNRTITVHYHLSDLSPECICGEGTEDRNSGSQQDARNAASFPCTCSYRYKGNHFEPVMKPAPVQKRKHKNGSG